MYTYSCSERCPYAVAQMYELVKDIEAYPSFVPWCENLIIRSHTGCTIVADMFVGMKSIRSNFTSKVVYNDDAFIINVSYIDGPFKHLSNVWKFIETPDGCTIDFYIEFEFKNRLLDLAFKPVFSTVSRRMVAVFLQRAKEVYTVS